MKKEEPDTTANLDTTANIEKKKRLNFIVGQLEANRDLWLPDWKSISSYIAPRKGRFDGEENNKPAVWDKIINAIATKAVKVLASGMQSGLTSPARPWFKLGFTESALSKDHAAMSWLGQVERIMRSALFKSGFYGSIHALYAEEALFGTAALFQEENQKHGFIFRNLTIGSYALGIGNDGLADTLSRKIFMTARQMVSEFGFDVVSESIKTALTDAPDYFFAVNHLIFPRAEYDVDLLDNKNMPWASIYWEAAGPEQSFLKESGYHEFPVFAPRWDVTAQDVYGQGPGMDALADIKGLQAMAKSELMAMQQLLMPPTQTPSSMKGRLDLRPGANNKVSGMGNDSQGIKPIYQIHPTAVTVAMKSIEGKAIGVKEWFFNDLFLMDFYGPNMTATEIMERREEKMLQLGPVIERQQFDLLDPLINRTFNILARQNAFPPPPPEIQGQELKVEYISLLAQAQKASATRSIEQVTGYIGNLAQMVPDVLDVFDSDSAVRELHEATGAPIGLMRGQAQVVEMRKSRAEAQQKQQEMQQGMAMAESAKTMSETNLDGNNALTEGMA